MAAPQKAAGPVLVFYHIPNDGDDPETPNAFPLIRPDGGIRLQHVRAKFPLPGSYHFRFKLKIGDNPPVWMDVTNEESQVPLFEGRIVAKVTRISWGAAAGGAAARSGSATTSAASPQAAASPIAQNGGARSNGYPQAHQDVFGMGDDPLTKPTPAAVPQRPAAPAAASPHAAAGRNDDFDMLFS
eukprot:TRINITY_DN8215_c0_g1_i1.p1 TRINITY_DN8215_c0_g1~~TRINITY_DN8215_c0_g1_i1.p1  ORF type:complete len:185 (-),score=46.33 TRINITY_DN8215_c0_g1_i1:188-742(-)